MGTIATPTDEPVMAFPTVHLLAAIVGASVLTAAGWLAVVRVGGADAGASAAGCAGAGLVALVCSAVLITLRPWRCRPVGVWVNMWLGATVVRLLLTPALAYLLYSAAPLSGTPLLLSVAITYVIVQLCEAAVLALHVRRVT